MENKNKYLVVNLVNEESKLFDTFLQAKEYVAELIDEEGADKEDIKMYQVTKSYTITKLTVIVTADEEIETL